jgi:hypothetical protein
MSIPNEIFKQPAESLVEDFDYTDALTPGDTLVSVSLRSDPDGVIGSVPIVGSRSFAFSINNGTNGQTYMLYIEVLTSSGEVIADRVRVVVQEKS